MLPSGMLFRCQGTEIKNPFNSPSGFRLSLQASLSAFDFGVINGFLNRMLLATSSLVNVRVALAPTRHVGLPMLHWVSLRWSVHLCYMYELDRLSPPPSLILPPISRCN